MEEKKSRVIIRYALPGGTGVDDVFKSNGGREGALSAEQWREVSYDCGKTQNLCIMSTCGKYEHGSLRGCAASFLGSWTSVSGGHVLITAVGWRSGVERGLDDQVKAGIYRAMRVYIPFSGQHSASSVGANSGHVNTDEPDLLTNGNIFCILC
jgi:hypothetical protein